MAWGNAGGQAQHQQLLHHVALGPQGVPVDVQGVFHPHQPPQAQNGGDELGDDGGPGHAGHIPVELGDKQQVQHDVEPAGYQQEDQRHHRIPHAPQHAGDDVVIGHARNAPKNNGQIVGCPFKNFRRRAHQLQKRGHQQRPHHHDDQRGQKSQRNGGSHRLGKLLPLLGAKILGHHDVCAGGDADEQHQQQIQHRAAGPHGGQGVIPYVTPHHNAVHCVVHLLGQVAQQQGDGKLYQLFDGAAHRHILGAQKARQPSAHATTPSLLSNKSLHHIGCRLHPAALRQESIGNRIP